MYKLHIQSCLFRGNNNLRKRWQNVLLVFDNWGRKLQVHLAMQLLYFWCHKSLPKNDDVQQ
jgi:hypothetical protein